VLRLVVPGVEVALAACSLDPHSCLDSAAEMMICDIDGEGILRDSGQENCQFEFLVSVLSLLGEAG
jgi:hypothetical protein